MHSKDHAQRWYLRTNCGRIVTHCTLTSGSMTNFRGQILELLITSWNILHMNGVLRAINKSFRRVSWAPWGGILHRYYLGRTEYLWASVAASSAENVWRWIPRDHITTDRAMHLTYLKTTTGFQTVPVFAHKIQFSNTHTLCTESNALQSTSSPQLLWVYITNLTVLLLNPNVTLINWRLTDYTTLYTINFRKIS